MLVLPSTTCGPGALYMFLEEFKFLFRILGCIYYVLKSAHLRGSFVRFPLWINVLAII
jgi:hypothetical protein